MFQTDQSTAASSLPTPSAAGTPGFFTGGNPASGTPATVVDPDWLNMIQQELINIVDAGGETPSKTAYNQVLSAIKALIAQPQTNLVSGVVGQMRNFASSVTAPGTTKPVTADEVIVESALGGLRYCLSNLNLTGNLATQMDTGSAPVSGFVAEYLIYNPAAAISATNPRLLYTNATSAVAPSVYGGSNMPAGYTVSGLTSVWPTNGSGQFVIGYQADRWISIVGVNAITITSAQATVTPFSIATIVPKNARSIAGFGACTNTANPGNNSLFLYSSAQQLGARQIGANLASTTGGIPTSISRMPLVVAQTLYYTANSNNTFSANFEITDYEI
jgi:hypothetical protein